MASKQKMSKLKKTLLIIAAIFGACLVVFVCYVGYVFGSFHRIEDNLEISPENDASSNIVTTGKEYKAVSYNTGFSAYLHDFNFFMDGGTMSWAKSLNSVISTTQDIARQLNSYNADFVSLQEVDFDSTRTYYVDESLMYKNALPQYN